MYEEQQLYKDLFYVMFYGGVMVMAFVACAYLLLRLGNAYAPDVTPPLRLRQWTAAFFALMGLGHVWWVLLTCYQVIDDPCLALAVGGGLDCLTLVPVMMVMLLVMLQDRRRPLWPIVASMVPIVVVLVVSMILHSDVYVPLLRVYIVLLCIGFVVVMTRAVRQYGRWLRDNYADLEHKEVWQSMLAILVCLMILLFYISVGAGSFLAYVVQLNDLVLLGLLLWRVETLQTLDDSAHQSAAGDEAATAVSATALSGVTVAHIGQLLEQRCEATQLYLRHDIRVDDLCRAIGTNRNYLSQYFVMQETTYNAYINNLRIEHFVRLYREAVAEKRPFTAQQLALESGFRSYSTFGMAFKQRMGQTATSWMRNAN
jgi:AraC-like DNA-binding protein